MRRAFALLAMMAAIGLPCTARAQAAAKPDAAKGQQIATQVCAACHAADWSSDASVAGLASSLCVDARLWGADLCAVPGFASAVADDLLRITRSGVAAALDAHLAKTAVT